MISNRRVDAAAGVRLLLLTVLLGLFAMHVLTAHGGNHHGLAAGPSSHAGADHLGATDHDGVSTATVAPGTLRDVAPVVAAPAAPTVPVNELATASPTEPGIVAGLALCWLLLTAGVALLGLLLRAGRSARYRVRPFGTPLIAGSSRPRAPPGRLRLHELKMLRV